MALVCDIKSNMPQEEAPLKSEEDLEDGEIEDDDDDEIPIEPPEEIKPDIPIALPVDVLVADKPLVLDREKELRPKERAERAERRRHSEEKGKKHMTEAEKSILHLRKREEMQRKKWEKFNRNKEVVVPDVNDDDFAKNIEKTLATILHKKEKEAAGISGGEEKEEEKRGKKRKKNSAQKKNKQRKLESPKSEFDENEMMNMRGGSPRNDDKRDCSQSPHSEESYESEYSSDFKEERMRNNKRNNKKGKRNNMGMKNRKGDNKLLKDSQGVCVFYLQGKCMKNDCPYSHEAVPPMKLELCKFYLMDCCAKGDKCSYMHSEFPCKFYHTGLSCTQGDECKFAHGNQLSEGLKQILFKHIETAPRDILGGFPRMSREEALTMINLTQTKLEQQFTVPDDSKEQETKGGIPSLFDINIPIPPQLRHGADDILEIKTSKPDKSVRNRPSRWQDPDPVPPKDLPFPIKPFHYGQDQDMRINSNGDIDMRTLPPALPHLPTATLAPGQNPVSVQLDAKPSDLDVEKYKRDAGISLQAINKDVDIRSLPYSTSKDIDIRQSILPLGDVDIRPITSYGPEEKDAEDEPTLQIDTGEDVGADRSGLPQDMPEVQRNLFMRIQAHQRENIVEEEKRDGYELEDSINWYSDDDDEDENRLMIKVENEDVKEKDEQSENADAVAVSQSIMSPTHIKPFDVVEKLGDLSKIDISLEVTKLLTSMTQSKNQFQPTETITQPSTTTALSDPRTVRQDPRTATEKSEMVRQDPRLLSTDPRQRLRQSSTDSKSDKVSIYEQGSIGKDDIAVEIDTDFRNVRSDVDLRNLQLPFKGMQNYTPASEIDASVNSHPLIHWKVAVVDIPRPDYTGLKLSVNDAEKTGDPRLRKIFRLSTEERDTPLSPKASPKAGTTTRVDPRLRKLEEAKSDPVSIGMNFNQQISMLQSSAFYQSLTSNQKVLLNKELTQRNDSSNSHDPVLNSMLSNLNIIPGAGVNPQNSNLGAALQILGKLNPSMLVQNQLQGQQMLGQNPMQMTQPGLLGAAPGIPNLPADYNINYGPRNGGLLGNVPMAFGNFPPGPEGPGFNNFNQQEEFYPQEGAGNYHNNNNNQGHRENSGNRGFNRDRRRGRNFNRNNGGNRNFRNNRNNRANRTHSPP